MELKQIRRYLREKPFFLCFLFSGFPKCCWALWKRAENEGKRRKRPILADFLKPTIVTTPSAAAQHSIKLLFGKHPGALTRISSESTENDPNEISFCKRPLC